MDNAPDISLFRDFFSEHGWDVKWEESRPARTAKLFDIADLGLDEAALRSLQTIGGKIYRHQREAIDRFIAGSNIAITTPTASGKTLVFNTCAIETLSRNPKARVAAIYPLKALASEQEKRWLDAVEQCGLDIRVGRIDGDVRDCKSNCVTACASVP